MIRHRFNPIALVLGLVFAAAGIIVLSGGELIDEGAPLVPAGLIALGVALLVQVGRRARTASDDDAPTGAEPAFVEPSSVGTMGEPDLADSDRTEVDDLDGDPHREPTGVDTTETIDPTTPYDRPDRPDRPEH